MADDVDVVDPPTSSSHAAAVKEPRQSSQGSRCLATLVFVKAERLSH